MPPENFHSLTVDDAIQQAVTHHQAGRLQDAEALYRAILKVLPNHPDANHNLGVLAFQVKQPTVGLLHLKTALEANPNQDQYWLSYINALIQTSQKNIARQVLEQGRHQGLRAEMVAALTERLDDVEIADQINAEYQHVIKESLPVSTDNQTKQQKKPKVNPSKANKSAKKDTLHKGKTPSPPEINALVALFTDGQYTEAITLAQTMAARFPLHGFGWTMLGILFNKMGRITDALLPLQKAAALSRGVPEVHFNLGNTLNDLGRIDEAVISYRRALKLKPDYAEAHVNLGATLHDLGQLDEAEASYRLALQIKPDYAEAHSNLGNTLKDLDRLDEAEVCYLRALEIKPDFFLVHSNLGITLMNLGRMNEAEACHRRALELKSDYPEAFSNLGITLNQLGRLDEAETCHRRALELKPDFAGAYSNLGATLYDLGRLDEAEACYRRALELQPDFAEVYSNLGNNLKDLGRLVEAEACYRRALELKPDYAEAHYNLGDHLSYMDNLEQEISAYQKALFIAPLNIGLSAAVMLAVRCYLAGDFSECRSLLSVSQHILAKIDDKSNTHRAYWLLLDRLLLLNQQFNQENSMETLHVIGESHCLPTHGAVISYRGKSMRCAAQWIAGCKQWHLADGLLSRYKYRYKFEMIMARLPQRSTILLTIGEIDCRPNEGIIKVWRKSPDKPLDSICHATSKSYLDHVAEVSARYGHQLVIGGVPAPKLSTETMTPEMAEQHINFIRTFNTILRNLALAANMDFLDIYALTDKGDGVASGKWHIDTFHLLPGALIEAFERHCRHP